MNNSLGKTHGVVSVEQPIEGLGPQGVGEMKRPPASNAETKIAELAERPLAGQLRKLRVDEIAWTSSRRRGRA